MSAPNAPELFERSRVVFKRTWVLAILGLTAIAIAVGCGGGAEKVVVRLTDTEGAVEVREITAEYVNDRLLHMPPHLVPDMPGDEGKKAFIDEIIRKELLVIQGYRLGIQNDPDLEMIRGLYANDKANQMFIEELINEPSEPSEADVDKYIVSRETLYTLLQLVVQGEEAAWDAYRRVTEDGEDFATVTKEVSIARSAADGGSMDAKLWPDFHPVVSRAIEDGEIGDITEPLDIGGPYHIYEIVGKRAPREVVPSDPKAARAAIAVECRNFRRAFREEELNQSMTTDADLRYNDPAVDLMVERLAAEVDKIIPDNILELATPERMEIARIPLIPKLTDEEKEMHFLSYKVGSDERSWSSGDFIAILEATPGIEGPKVRDPYGLKLFIWRKVREELIEHEIERRGYRDTQELNDYLDERQEEFIVNSAYEREVNAKVDEATGEEVKEYFRAHREDYVEPTKVDLRLLIASSEADANMIRQRISNGEATFEDMVEQYSIEPWSKTRGGLIEGYLQGERKLSFLQDVAFDIEIGVLSDPFPAVGGFAIIEILKSYPSREMEFSEVADIVIGTVNTQRTEARLQELLDELRETVEIEWVEENLSYVKDTAEARQEKTRQFTSGS
jgi:peptidyl-prolyl cis-trans isomerase C